MNLKSYLKTLDEKGVKTLADALQTTPAYLQQLAYGHRKAGAPILLRIEVATNNLVSQQELRPDLYQKSVA